MLFCKCYCPNTCGGHTKSCFSANATAQILVVGTLNRSFLINGTANKWIKIDNSVPWYYFPCLNKINNCGEPGKFQERLSSNKATASQPYARHGRYVLQNQNTMIVAPSNTYNPRRVCKPTIRGFAGATTYRLRFCNSISPMANLSNRNAVALPLDKQQFVKAMK